MVLRRNVRVSVIYGADFGVLLNMRGVLFNVTAC